MSGAAVARLKPARRPLPAGWRWVRLGEVCASRVETCDPSVKPDHPFAYVDITSIDSRRKVIVEPKILRGRDAPSRARQRIRCRDVIVSTTRPNLNAVAMIPPELDRAVCSTGFCVLRPKEGLDPHYLFAFVQRWEFVHSLSELVKGALYPAVTDRQVLSQTVPLPPLPEQRRIAAIFRGQMTAIGKARAAAEAQLEAAKGLSGAYLRDVFQSPAAENWPRGRVGHVATLLPARSISSDGDTDVLAITTACLTESGFEPSGVKKARMWARDAAACRVSPGEILVARSNTPELVGRVSLYTGQPPGVVASDLTIRLSTHSQCHAPFLSAYLSFLYLTGYWREKAGGASGSMKKITRRQIVAEQVPLPELSEQERIAAELRASGDCAEKIKRAAAEQLAEIERLPASLLRRAFNGDL